ncbi:hypothetical protein [Paenibacillus sp. NAIST15-1]|uniref:hypothetical protein n=1 Tax=Paenibacillus sp. NAIST15-1 TaxID=1605994 RepID=UPI00086DDD6F|nr:hypothetical protein [Paenibacillus sp. NAIST15-1]GAV11393.1 hypothetical protein PBN151_1322 [Paenibacillus sp. NAIST15-1]
MNFNNKMNKLREEIELKQRELDILEKDNFNPLGKWRISTEGDCEGRSKKQLGDYTGNLLDIVKQLSNQAFYSLDCERVEYLHTEHKKESKEVHFRVIDKSIKLFDKDEQLRKLLPHVSEGHSLSHGYYFGAVKLEWEEK